MRQADAETLHLIRGVVKRKGWIDLPSYGTSMFPLIREDDVCRFVSCGPADLQRGDVVLFVTAAGQLVAHRFYRTEWIHNKAHYLCKGDTNLGFDEPVSDERIIGRLAYIQKKNRRIQTNRLIFDVWGRLVVSIPHISWLLRMYLNRKQGIN